MKVISDPRAIEKKECFKQALSLFFPNFSVEFLPESILLIKEGSAGVIDDNSFDIIKNLIMEICCLKGSGKGGFDPVGKKAEEIAKKLLEARKKVAKEKGEEDSSMFVTYMSCASIALHIPIQTVADYTLF
jgi:hypothetical protein